MQNAYRCLCDKDGHQVDKVQAIVELASTHITYDVTDFHIYTQSSAKIFCDTDLHFFRNSVTFLGNTEKKRCIIQSFFSQYEIMHELVLIMHVENNDIHV